MTINDYDHRKTIILVMPLLLFPVGGDNGIGIAVKMDEVSSLCDFAMIQVITDFIKETTTGNNIILATLNADTHVSVVTNLMTNSLRAWTPETQEFLLRYYGDTVTISATTIDHLTEQFVNMMGEVALRDNIPSTFIIIQTEEMTEKDIIAAIIKIKEWDNTAKVAVFYYKAVDIEASYKSKQLYDIYLYTPLLDGANKVVLYHEYTVCMFCASGDDLVQVTNTWRPGAGFQHAVTMGTSFMGNFYGNTVSMGIGDYWTGYVGIIGTDENGENILGGYNYDNYVVLAEMLNLNWKFVKATDGIGWHATKINETTGLAYAVGSLADLLEGTVDILGAGWIGRYDRSTFADLVGCERYTEGKAIITAEPYKGIRWNAFVTVFPWYLWFLVGISIVAASLVLYLLRSYRGDEVHGTSWSDAAWTIVQIAAWDKLCQHQPSWGMITHLSVFLMMIQILVNMYMGEYTAILTIPKYEKPPIETFEALWESELKVITYGAWYDESIQQYGMEWSRFEQLVLSGGKNGDLETLLYVLKFPDTYSRLTRAVGIKRNFAELAGGRRLYIGKEKEYQMGEYLYMRRSSLYKSKIKYKLMILQDMGILDHEPGRNISLELEWDIYNHQVDTPVFITFSHFASGLLIPLVGYSLAVIVFIIEIITGKLRTRNYIPKKPEVNQSVEIRKNLPNVKPDGHARIT